MIIQKHFVLAAKPRGVHKVTAEVMKNLPELPDSGLLSLFIRHTSAALAINENADPDVCHDMAVILDHIVPENSPIYTHVDEGSDDMPAHAKAVLVGPSLTIPIEDGHLALGRWQGIYLCEFRNYGGPRNIIATVIGN